MSILPYLLDSADRGINMQYGIRRQDLCKGGRQRRFSEPRSVAALIVRETDQLSLMDLSRNLKRDLSGLSQAAIRLDQRLESDKELSKKVNKI